MVNLFEAKNNFTHEASAKVGVLISNLGTPDAPTKQALKVYLREFLSDPRVIELPRLKWLTILNLFVLTSRPKKSAELYQSIWTENGSPLMSISREQEQKLRMRLEKQYGKRVVVALGMRYGNPSIASALRELRDAGAEKIFVLPLYPQYSSSTVGSTFDAVADALKKWRVVPELRFQNAYHDEPLYIQALSNSVRESFALNGKPQKLIFSFHGIPKRYFENGDPYFCYCHKTTRLVAENLGLKPEEYQLTFQSLFGKEEWLKPYTDETLKGLAESGVTSLQVICPGFSADCLETLEEIDEQNRELFLHHGGKIFHYIPALNAREDLIDTLEKIVSNNISDWLAVEQATRRAGGARNNK